MIKRLEIFIILILLSIISNAQNKDIKNAQIIRINDGGSTSMFKLFEIDINKKEIYIINPIMNYLDIVGGKYKYEVYVESTKWNKIEKLLSEVNLSNYNKVEFNGNDYSITLFFEETKGDTYFTQIESELIILKEILQLLRE